MSKKRSEQELQSFPLQPEVPPKTGGISWDYRMLWGGFSLLLALIGMGVASATGHPLRGIAWIVVVALGFAYTVLVPLFDGASKSALTKGTEVATQAFYGAAGWKQHVGDEVGMGDSFDAAGKPVELKSPKYSKLLGKITVAPYDVGSDSGPVGVTYDRRTRGFTITMWISGTPLAHMSASRVKSRLKAFADTLDASGPDASTIGRLAWRTQTFLDEPIDENLLREVVGRPASAVRGINLLREVAAELSEKSPRAITTLSLTILKPNVKRERRDLGSYEAVLWEEVQRFVAIVQDETQFLSSAKPLSYNQTVAMMRVISDPVYVERFMPRIFEQASSDALFDPELALPQYYDFKPSDRAQVGNTCHGFFYVETLDRTPVTLQDFQTLHEIRVPKTITDVEHMLSRRQARRRALYTANAAHSGLVDKQGSGARVSGATRVLAEETDRAEEMLIKGQHVYGRKRLYVDITGASPGEYTAHVRLFQRGVSRTNLVLVPCLGTQEEGLRATLPLGAGLETIWLPKSMQ